MLLSGLPWWLRQKVKKHLTTQVDLGLIPGLRRTPAEGNGNSLQYSCWENPTDSRAWQAMVHGVTKSQTQLSE